MVRLIYDLAISLYAFGIRIASLFNKKARLWIRGRKGLLSQLKEHLPEEGADLWIHCASLGEFEQGRPLIEALRKAHPDLFILLTFFSPSGYEVRKEYDQADFVCYLPADTRKQARAFLSLVKPTLTVFVKYEFWYNFIKTLQDREHPIVLISGIFREEQLFFKSYGGLFRKMLARYDRLFVQDRASLELLDRIAVRNVVVAGDTRFDRVIRIAEEAKQLPFIEKFVGDAYCWVAGSTWPPDESMISEIFDRIPKWIIAPHEIHEAHLKEIEARFPGQTIRYSRLIEAGENEVQAKALLIDNFGLLSSVYRLGHVAYVGGGFGVGIHNILEAAVFGIPVVFGPNYERFREAKDILKQEAAFSYSSVSQLETIADRLADPSVRESIGRRAGEFVKDNGGATRKILNFFQEKRFFTRL